MPRLNNKDFTVEELERIIYLLNSVLYQSEFSIDKDGVRDELAGLLKGTTLADAPQEPHPVIWNFNFKLEMHPQSTEQSIVIKNAMRSKEVNETINSRFRHIVFEELNRYNDQVRVLMLRGDSNILE
jgi:hypothetical protein